MAKGSEGSGDERAIQLKFMQDASRQGLTRLDVITIFTIAMATGQGLGIVKTIWMDGKEKYQEAFRSIGRPIAVPDSEQHYKPLESDT
jgi:hypothetical protein